MNWRLICAIFLVAIATNGCYGGGDASNRDNTNERNSGSEDNPGKELRILLKRILEDSTPDGSSHQDEDSPPATGNSDSGSDDDCIGLACLGFKKRGCTGAACWDDPDAKRGEDAVTDEKTEEVKTEKSSSTNEDTPPATGNGDSGSDDDCIGLACLGFKRGCKGAACWDDPDAKRGEDAVTDEKTEEGKTEKSSSTDEDTPTTTGNGDSGSDDDCIGLACLGFKRGCTGAACWDDPDAKRGEDATTSSSETEERKAEEELKKVAGAGCVNQCQAGCMYSYVDALVEPLNEGEDCDYRKTAAKDDFNGCLKSCDVAEKSPTDQEKRGRFGSTRAQDAAERTCMNSCRKAYKTNRKNKQKYTRKSARAIFSTCTASCVD